MDDSAPVNTHPLVWQWLRYLDEQGKSQNTIAAYRRALQHFERWHVELQVAFDPLQIFPRDVRDWKHYQQTQEGARPRTINQRLSALAQFYEWLILTERVSEDPTHRVNGLQLQPRQPQALDGAGLRQLLRAVYAAAVERDIAIIEVLLGTGLRVSELLALQVGDVLIRPRSGRVTVRYGKGGNYRMVPLPQVARAAIQEYLVGHPHPHDPNQALWWGERGALQSRSAITRILEKYAQLAQIPPFGPHVLRHTFATRYLNANPDDLRGLAALLGHSSLDSVMIYTEPTFDDLAQRLERM